MDCSPPGSSVRGSLQARTLEWVAISFSRGTSRPRNWTRISSIAGRFFTRTELSGKTDTYVVTRCREVPALPATLLRGLSQRQSRDWRTHTESGYSSLCRWRKALTWATNTFSASPGAGWNSPWVEFKLRLRENAFCSVSHQAELLHQHTLQARWSWLLGPTLVANERDTANSLSEKSY